MSQRRLRCSVVVLCAILFASGAATAHAQCTLGCAATVPSSGTAGASVSFQSAASPCNCPSATTYAWDFGDAQSSSQANPSHTYSSPGTYNWSLTVGSGATTCNKSGTIRITSGGVVPLAGTYSASGSNVTLSFTVNSSSQITSYSFSYTSVCGSSGSGSGSGTSSIVNGNFSLGLASCIPFTNQAAFSGTFSTSTDFSGTMTLRASGQFGCYCTSSPQSFSGSLSPPPLVAGASADVSNGDAPLSVNFTGSVSGGTGPYTYNWDFGDCSSASSTQNPSPHTYQVGSWSAVFQVTDSAARSATAIVPITASPGPAASFAVSAPAAVVAGTPFTVTATAYDAHGNIATTYAGEVGFSSNDPSAVLPSTYTFQSGDGGLHTFTDGVTLNSVGSRTVTVTDTSNGSLTGTANVTVGHATTTTVTSSPNPTAQAASTYFTAHVTSPTAGTITGTVTFKDGATTLVSIPLSDGAATVSTAFMVGGPHSITAEYSGDSAYLPSTSSIYTHYVLLSAPSSITATASSPTSVDVSWSAVPGADHYELFRSTNNVSFGSPLTIGSTSYPDTVGLASDTAYFYRVRAVDAGGNAGATSASDVATTIVFIDDPIVQQSTVVKAVHVMQLRTAVNALRAAAGQGTATFADDTIVRALHIEQLRDEVTAIRSTLSLSPPVFAEPLPTAGVTLIKASHFIELRDAVK